MPFFIALKAIGWIKSLTLKIADRRSGYEMKLDNCCSRNGSDKGAGRAKNYSCVWNIYNNGFEQK